MKYLFSLLVCAVPLAMEAKVALVTGAAKGLGLEVAKRFSEEGYTVYGTSRSENLPSAHGIHYLTVDLTSEQSIGKAVSYIIEKEGQVDLLVNNAACAFLGPIESMTGEEIYEQVDINFLAPIRMIQATLPIMRANKSGHIINISSSNAFMSPPFGSIYGASKAALESFSEALAIEVKPYNIHVSIIEPGILNTRFPVGFGTKEIEADPYTEIMDEIRECMKERIAHPELISRQEPADVAALIYEISETENPKLRYQTSEEAITDVSTKLKDLTGDAYLESMQ